MNETVFLMTVAVTRQQRLGAAIRLARKEDVEWTQTELADRIESMAWAAVVDGLSRLLPPDAMLAEARRRYVDSAPGSVTARHDAEIRQRGIALDHERWLYAYTSGNATRVRFDREMARLAAESETVDATLAALPEPPDETALAALWESLRTIADAAAYIEPQDRAAVLRRLGVAVVRPSGVTLPGKGGPDSGRVEIRYHPEVAACLQNT